MAKAWLNDYVYKHTMGYDADNQLYFFKSFRRIEDLTTEVLETNLNSLFTTDTNHSFPLIIFTHERCVYNFDKDFNGNGMNGSGVETNYSIKEKLEFLCEWAKTNNYDFNYPQYTI